jgi:hypothetical protein
MELIFPGAPFDVIYIQHEIMPINMKTMSNHFMPSKMFCSMKLSVRVPIWLIADKEM